MEATARHSPTRRLGWLAPCIIVTACLPVPASGQASKPETVRDRLWIFCCATNSDFPHIGRRSVVSPAEGTVYLGVPNIQQVGDTPLK